MCKYIRIRVVAGVGVRVRAGIHIYIYICIHIYTCLAQDIPGEFHGSCVLSCRRLEKTYRTLSHGVGVTSQTISKDVPSATCR